MAASISLVQDARDYLRNLLLPVPGRERLLWWELGAEPGRTGRFIIIPAVIDPNSFRLVYCALQIVHLFPEMDAGGRHRLVDLSQEYTTPALTVWHTVNAAWIAVRLSERLALPGEPYMIIRPDVYSPFKRG